jgi:hypothetical protein
VLGGHLGVGNLHVLVVVFIIHKIVTLSITWVFDPAMIVQVGEGEVTNMLLLDLEKLDNEESNDRLTLAALKWSWIGGSRNFGLGILPHLAINHYNDTKNIMMY